MGGEGFSWDLGAIVGSLAAAIVALWKIAEVKNSKAIAAQEAKVEQLQKRADVCERDREDLRVRIAQLEARAEEEAKCQIERAEMRRRIAHLENKYEGKNHG